MEASHISRGVDKKMDRQVLLRKIMGAGDEIRRLEQDVVALQSIDIVNYPENYSSLSHQAVIKSEFITRKLRELVYSTTNVNWPELLAGIADELGITVEHDADGIIEITIPCLIPHRRKKQSGFIIEPLYAALERFVSAGSLGVVSSEADPLDLDIGSSDGRHAMPFERFKHCVICITHVYDKELFGKGRKRDHDNIEIKGIIDVINTFLLTDDNESLCDIYTTSELSDQDITCISIMKKDMFSEWVKRHKIRLITLS